jgi:redox-sensitive bicupin YhaK (pirin superfamily)
MSSKSIGKIVDAGTVFMGKYKLKQPLPVKGLTQVDPFLLIHHGGPEFQPPGTPGLNVEAHPHTGFQPVTFVFSGEVEHRDSLGNISTIRSGGIQWINAGKGIVHSEKASSEFIKKGGEFEIIQLWINLTRNQKKSDPEYVGLEENDIPFHLSEDRKTRLNIISGSYGKLQGPVTINSDIIAYTGKMEIGGMMDLDFDPKLNVLVYLLGGNISIDHREISSHQMIVFNQDGKNISIKANEKSRLLILAGVPIKQPVYHYGPFVLNSKAEVVDAINDYESGKMGHLD